MGGFHRVVHVVKDPSLPSAPHGGHGPEGGGAGRARRRQNLPDDVVDQIAELLVSHFHRNPQSVILSISFPTGSVRAETWERVSPTGAG
jgi:hypothetical protein